jgi:redox-sensitive bicupin YhaK (pirin superfamily)
VIAVRKSDQRGQTRLSWLDSRHTFSFGDYFDPAHMGFGALRVINDDRVAPGGGFATHGHRDMEIVTYVLAGAVSHRDSLGHEATVAAGEVQRMTAGSGILHSEFNRSADCELHFLQIWIEPDRPGLVPGYEQRTLPPAGPEGGLRVVVSPDGRDGSLLIHQDAVILAGHLAPGTAAEVALGRGRRAWVQVARGAVAVNGVALAAGDGAAVTGEAAVQLAGGPGEALVFDLA